MTTTAQGMCLQTIDVPAMCPEGQRAGGQAKLLGRRVLPYPLLHGQTLEGYRMYAGLALGFAPGLLGGPAALSRLAGAGSRGQADAGIQELAGAGTHDFG